MTHVSTSARTFTTLHAHYSKLFCKLSHKRRLSHFLSNNKQQAINESLDLHGLERMPSSVGSNVHSVKCTNQRISKDGFLGFPHSPCRSLRMMSTNRYPKNVQRHAMQRELISRIDTIIRDHFGKHYEVQPFGSSVYMRDFGVAGTAADLDLVVLDQHRPLGLEPGVRTNKLDRIYNMRILANTLRRNGFSKVFAIPNATAPIVKCYDPCTSLSLDINVNERLGLINSHLLRAYCDLLPGLRALLAAIKLWAKPLGLNSPTRANVPVTFSTYALILMAIGWLQSRHLAPNLQDDLPSFAAQRRGAAFWARVSSRKHAQNQRIACDVRFREATSEESRPPLNLRSTLAGWFRFWGYEFDYPYSVVDIKDGGIGSTRDAEMTMNQDETEVASTPNPQDLGKRILVVDPFLRSKNVAKNVSPKMVAYFCDECRNAFDRMEANVAMNEIIPHYDDLMQKREPTVELPKGPAGVFDVETLLPRKPAVPGATLITQENGRRR